MLSLQSSVSEVKGVGEKKHKLLNNLGIFSVEDLLFHYPRRYENRVLGKKISQVKHKERVCLKCKVVRINVRNLRNRKIVVDVVVKDDTGFAQLTFFNNPYIVPELIKDRDIIFYGEATEDYHMMKFNSPEYEFDKSTNITDCIYPVYPLTKGLKNREIMRFMDFALKNTPMEKIEYLDLSYRKLTNILDEETAIRNIHFPENLKVLKESMYRLIFDEFFTTNLFLNYTKKLTKSGKSFSLPKEELANKVRQSLPYELTQGQSESLEEIFSDLSSPIPMRRLLQGDVGSGKTVVATLSLVKTVENGYQGAFMVPTEILALQHYEELSKILKDTDIKVSCITGSNTKKEKDKIYEELESGEIDIIIGTHALIQQQIKFKSLALVVTDEQHRFGVLQRKQLEEKTNDDYKPNILVMTATPIPRTLSFILSGDLDISIIRQMPKGRKKIITMAYNEKMENKAYELVEKELKLKHQVYMVCPLIEESEVLDLNSAQELVDRLKTKIFPNYNIVLIHGKIRPKEKEQIMKEFEEGKIDILVSTTVIEVGINVANATVMVVQDAQRFGLAQLHQLRGRVGRSSLQSYCLLIYKDTSNIVRERIRIMTSTTDGFEIANKDMELRGPGEIFGTKQHGIMEFKIGDVVKHTQIMKATEKLAIQIIDQDPDLEKEENKPLRKKLAENLEKMRVS